LAVAVAETREATGRVNGTLRINTLGIAARTLIAPRLARFHQVYPDVVVDIVVDDALSDIVSGRFDAGIRVGGQLEKDMVAIRLTPDLNMVAVASPDYVARRGTPRSPTELQDHACINWRLQSDGRQYRWEFKKRGRHLEVAVDGPVVTNHADVGIAAALAGLGIAYHFEQDRVGELLAQGLLVRVLADWSVSRPGLFLYYPNRRHRPALLGAFIDCLLNQGVFGNQ
jgi:DNA-binding transcriptional LysR family regulator